MAEKKTKRGRPTVYTPDLAKEICDHIASTSQGTKKLCKEKQHWPCQDTLFTWLKIHPEFSEQYARAKKCQIDVLVDEILEIADDASHDQFTNNEGRIVINFQAVNRARLKIDTRKWLACKLVPKIYGQKPDNESEFNSQFLQEAKELRDRLDAKNRKEY